MPENSECTLLEVSFRGTTINVGVYKDGASNKKDILLLHGLGSNAAEFYEKMIDNLPKDRLCAIDWLGHGQTTKLLKSEDTYDAVYLSEYLKVVLNALIEKKILAEEFFVVAKSMSAIPLAYLYDNYKDNFKKIVLIAPAGFDEKMGYLFAFFSSFITRNIILSWFFSWFILDRNKRKILQSNLKIKDWGEIVSRYSRAGYDLFGHMHSTHIVGNVFNKIDKPILLICGTRDFIFPKRNYLNFAKDNKWEVLVLEGKEHSLEKKNYEKFKNSICKFIEIQDTNPRASVAIHIISTVQELDQFV